jgi:hypothetical protein
MAFQMLFTIGIGVFLGMYLDEEFKGDGLILALVSLVFVFISIYLGIKDLIFKK